MKPRSILVAVLAALAVLAPALQAQVTIPESVALPSSSLDTTKPGFNVRVVQASSTIGELANTLVRTEAQLAGLLLKQDGTPVENIADPSLFNAEGILEETGFIAYGAAYFPGIPGTELTVNNIALEAITYANLAPGTYSMIVNSDDGFRVTTGDVRDRAKEIVLGFYDGGRGAGDTVFNFVVTKAGVYPFRLIYEQGGGGYSVDWYSANPTDPADRLHIGEGGTITPYRALKAGTPQAPAITALQPANGATGVSPSTGLLALITDGNTAVPAASVKVEHNGVDVTSSTTITKTGKITRVLYKPSTLPEPLSVQNYILTFDDATAAGGKRVAPVSYTTAAYANYILPAPLYYQDFNGVAEGTLPSGWTTFSPIEPTGDEDLSNANSASYNVWVVISRERVTQLNFNSARRLNTPEAYVNGVKVASLVDGNFAYHESDIRSGSQYAELISPAIDLTGKTSVYLVYNSIYEQNQDNIAGTEYSIDDGKTWLPVVYMIDVPDITLKPDGSVDAEATLTAPRTDTASYPDPTTGETIGLTYGAFVKSAPATWKDIGAFISGRINDNVIESKRIEKFRLAKADGQSKVRLRFFQAGTASWYYGVDNVGLYSITTIDPPALAAQPESISRLVGASATFTVKGTGEQLAYQWKKDGTDIPGATNATYTIAAIRKSDAGSYSAVISNPSGSVTSNAATLAVQDIPGDASSLKTGLAVYLPFDGTYNDASGNGKNGTAVGSPTFQAGKIGTGAVKVSSLRSSQTYNFVTLGKNDTVPFGQSKDFTVAYWAKAERVDGDPSVVANKAWSSGNNVGWSIGTQTDGRLEWNYRRTGVDGLTRKDLDAAGQKLADPVWHHVVVVFEINGNAVSYVDGVQVDSKSIAPGTGNLIDPALSLNIGQDGSGAYDSGEWDGLVDDLAIWDRTLSAGEVSTLYAYGAFGDSFLAPPITSDLAVHLKFDGNYNDASGHNKNGTAVGSPTLGAGLIGSGAVKVSSVRDSQTYNYVTLGSNDTLLFGETKDFTVAFWMKPERVAGDPSVVANKAWSSGNNTGWTIGTQSDGRLEWNYRRTGEGLTRKDLDAAGQKLADPVWRHIVVAWGINGNAVSYVDGIQIDSRSIAAGTGTLNDAALALNIGQDGSGAYDSGEWDGLVDDLGIWERVLTPREVATLYGQGLNGKSLDGSGGSTPASLTVARAANGVTVSWTGSGKLQSAPAVNGPWTEVAGAASPATRPTSAAAEFFRVVQ